VPLGATTYYFPTLNDLVAAGLQQVSEAITAELTAWAAELTTADLPATLSRLAASYAADRGRALVEYELYLAAARDERLRPLAQAWLDGLTALLTPLVDPATARIITILLDGTLAQAIATGEDLDTATLRDAITRVSPGGAYPAPDGSASRSPSSERP
jgi:DNA-binding transcriptional regulator YbjK